MNRRPFQFGLKAFLVLFSILALLLAWLVPERSIRVKDAQAMKKLRSMGCRVSYYNGWDDDDSTWFEKRLDDCFGRRARTVRWNGARIHDLSVLQEIADLREVFIFDSTIEDISPLSSIHSIKHLHLTGSNIVDLTPLHSLANLKELNVYRTPVSAGELKRFSEANPNCALLHPSTEQSEKSLGFSND